MSELIFKDESYSIMGACFNVYKDKGCGFLESVYQECLKIEFEHLAISFLEQVPLELSYRGRKLAWRYVPDFICYGKIVVEIKAVQSLGAENRAQVMNYLKATGFSLGLLVNFGHYPRVESDRIVSQTSLSLSSS